LTNAERTIDMWLTKKILVPSDFAGPSRAAADVALELAQRFAVPLTVVHVYPVPATIYAGVPFVPVADYLQAFEDAAQSQLNSEAERLRGKGAEVNTVLKMGAPWEEILEMAKRLDVGLIVMGTHGRRGLPRALLGSVAEKVVRLSPVPVLTMHAAEG
jgi:nucleotide-binding universal stress UspA family protein